MPGQWGCSSRLYFSFLMFMAPFQVYSFPCRAFWLEARSQTCQRPGPRLPEYSPGFPPHQIPWFLHQAYRVLHLDDFIHGLRRPPLPSLQWHIHRSLKRQSAACARRAGPGGSSLIDAKQHLLRVDPICQLLETRMLRFASLQPTKGSFTGLFHIRIGRRILHTLIKRHGNVRTQVPLNLYTLLRPHEDTAPINVGGKGDPSS